MTGGVTDEFVEPVVCDAEGTISDNDSVIFFNFRPDRAREITRDPGGPGVRRLHPAGYFPVTFVCNTEYDASMPNVQVAFPRRDADAMASASISASMGMTQLPHRRDGEVRPCDLLLQRRRRDGVPRRGPGAGPLPQGGHLRSPAGDERLRGDATSAWSALSPAPMT